MTDTLTPKADVVRLRGILYQPAAVWIASDNYGDRWITDDYVMLKITDSPALQCYDASYGVEWPDGPYKLLASGEVRVEPRPSIPEPDLDRYFKRVGELTDWRPAEPTEWSIAEHPGKAQLWTSDGIPCLLGESTWSAIKRHYPDVEVSYGHGKLNMFRFRDRGITIAAAAGIRCPEGQEDAAYELVRALDATRDREAA